MARRLTLKRVIRAPLAPGTARDLLLKIQSSGDRPKGTLTCPTCARRVDASLPNGGHELPDAEGNGGCEQKRIIDAPAGGCVDFSRSSKAFPDEIGCDTCQLFDTCSIRKGMDRQLLEFGETYFGITGLQANPGAPVAQKLMIAHALVAEVCDRWVERK